MNLDQKYLALDLELNNAPDGSTPNPSIIQIGVAIGSAREQPSEWITKQWYVKVNEPIYSFITDLTGITNEDISQFGMTHYDIGQELSRLIKDNDVFVNPVTWGGGDSTELKDEFDKHGNPNSFSYFNIHSFDYFKALINKINPKLKIKFIGFPTLLL